MKFFCDNCQAQYMISDEKVGASGVRVRCKKCQHVIYVKRLEADPSAGEKTVIAPPMLQAAQESAPNISGSGIFSTETPAEAQRFEAEIGLALDSVFAESPAATAPPLDEGEPPQADQDSTPDDAGAEEPATDSSDDALTSETRSPYGVQVPAGGSLVVDWFIAIRDEQVGPLTAEAIKDRFERGEVGSDTLVWSAGLTDWRPLSTVQELAQMIVPREAITRSEASTSNPRGEMPREVPARKDSPAFKPSAASALASLASMAQEEIAAAARATPAPPPAWMPGVAPASAPGNGLLPEVPIVTAPATAPAPTGNGQYHPADERPSYASYAAPRARTSWLRLVTVGAAVVLVLGGSMAAAFWFMVLKPQREQAARFAEELTAQLAAKPRAPEAPPAAQRQAAAPSPPPAAAPAPSPVAVAAAPPPTVNGPPAPGPSKATAAEAADRHGKAHKMAPPKSAATGEAAPAAPKAAAPSNAEDFLAGAGDSAIDKEFARELDGAGGAEGGSKKAGAKHAPYIPPPPGQTDLPQQLNQSDVIGVVAQHKDAFGHCVQEQKKRDPGSSGTVVMHWKIKPDGHTSDVAAAAGDYQDSALASCFKGQIVKMKFGQYRGAPMAPIQFPFNF